MAEQRAQADAEDPGQEVEWTNIGRSFGVGDKVIYGVLRGDPPAEVYFGRSMFPTWSTVGQTFIVTVFADGTFANKGPKGPRFVRVFEDPDRRAAWSLRDREVMLRVEQERAAKRAGGDPVRELATPLRELYRKASPPQRAILLQRVIAEIMS